MSSINGQWGIKCTIVLSCTALLKMHMRGVGGPGHLAVHVYMSGSACTCLDLYSPLEGNACLLPL